MEKGIFLPVFQYQLPCSLKFVSFRFFDYQFQVLLRESYEDIRASCVGLMQTIMDIKGGLQGMNLNLSRN